LRDFTEEKAMFSPMDIGILAGVALLVFGPKKFPELGASLGKGIGNFKKAMNEVNDEISTAIKTEPAKPASQEAAGNQPVTAAPSPAPAQAAAAPPQGEAKNPENPPDKA
jgi:sec-independent protein translocase protein TatA